MKKLTIKHLLILLAFFTITTVVVSQLHVVFAEDEDEDERREDSEDREDEDEYQEDRDEEEQAPATAQERVVETITVTEYVTVEQEPEAQPVYATVIDAGYNIDSDKDGLVDAIDPNPSISEKLLFTDTDKDSVSDALDKHLGENDFSFIEDTDANSNGIIDSYE
jgi:hypothetical protein